MSTTETTPDTTEATEAPATDFAALAVNRLPGKFDSDGSRIMDVGKATEHVKRLAAIGKPMSAGMDAIDTGSPQITRLSWDIRANCELNGAPDWAGDSAAYAALFKNRLTRLFGADKATRMTRAADGWARDNGYRELYLAEHVIATTPELRKAHKDLALSAVPGELTLNVDVPADVHAAVIHEAGRVKTAGGTTKQGFKVTDLPAVSLPFGETKAHRVKREADSGITAARRSENDKTPAAVWEKCRNTVTARTDEGEPKIAPLFMLGELHHLASDAALAIVGTTEAPLEVVTKAKVVGEVGTLRDLLSALIDVIEGNDRAPMDSLLFKGEGK